VGLIVGILDATGIADAVEDELAEFLHLSVDVGQDRIEFVVVWGLAERIGERLELLGSVRKLTYRSDAGVDLGVVFLRPRANLAGA
jgi:hypothetical protein